MGTTTRCDFFYTADHEWINFKGSIAYVGICSFKLTGFREIHSITFQKSSGFLKAEEVIATISYNDYRIEAHMPVDGKILQLNKTLLSEGKNILVKQPENSGWIAVITPAQPYERKGLLLPKTYQLNLKRRHAK
ncbi:MAG TPA: hypothetical protein VG738_19315 [Chitinophagaceae bacterium]|nr:hypothetical protein [Chitinophagaceae bacterium]